MLDENQIMVWKTFFMCGKRDIVSRYDQVRWRSSIFQRKDWKRLEKTGYAAAKSRASCPRWWRGYVKWKVEWMQLPNLEMVEAPKNSSPRMWIVATVYWGVFSPRVVDAGRVGRPRCARGQDDRKIKVFFILWDMTEPHRWFPSFRSGVSFSFLCFLFFFLRTSFT